MPGFISIVHSFDKYDSDCAEDTKGNKKHSLPTGAHNLTGRHRSKQSAQHRVASRLCKLTVVQALQDGHLTRLWGGLTLREQKAEEVCLAGNTKTPLAQV